MDSIEVVENLIKKYDSESLNEADTRFKIIDEILEKILGWPKDNINCEFHLDSGFTDYILLKPNKKPALIIEAKKEGFYFQLPSSPNEKNYYRKIKIKELLTNPNIKQAINQVKIYCEDMGSDFACICNGHTWIFFYLTPQNTPWKDLPAYVITSLKYFSDHFTLSKDIFGFSSVVQKYSLRKHIGTAKYKSGEIYYPKSSIISYNTPVNNNNYANALNLISRRYLTNIPIDDADFMEHCYVTHRDYHETLEKNIDHFIYDALTPYFKQYGYQELGDEKKGGSFGEKVSQIIKRENRNVVVILFGGRGSGKSTFIKRYLYYIAPNPVKYFSVISIIDLINCSQNQDELSNDIWWLLCNDLDKDKILEGTKADLLDLFIDRFSVLKKQLLANLPEESEEYRRLINDFIINTKNDTKYCCERLSVKHKNKQKGLIIVLDNMDQLPPHLQDVCFLTAKEIANKLSSLVIISMREERFYNAKKRGVLDAYHNFGFHLSSPIITEVLQKRIIYILRVLRDNKKILEDSDLSDKNKDTINKFFEVCLRNLRNSKSPLNEFMANTTHGDVRQALTFFGNFLTSGYTDIDEMSNPVWRFARHQVFKPMMVPDRFFYDGSLSDIPNIYQIRNEENGSHFTSLRLLNYLDTKSLNQIKSGFVDAKLLVQEFEMKYNLRVDTENSLDILIEKGLIETSNRLEYYNDDVDQIRITSFGKYIFNILSKDFTYLDLVCLDCGLYSEALFNQFCSSANNELRLFYDKDTFKRINVRLDRVEQFINYLVEQEDYEFNEFGLDASEKRFASDLVPIFKTAKERVLESAKKSINKNTLFAE